MFLLKGISGVYELESKRRKKNECLIVCFITLELGKLIVLIMIFLLLYYYFLIWSSKVIFLSI